MIKFFLSFVLWCAIQRTSNGFLDCEKVYIDQTLDTNVEKGWNLPATKNNGWHQCIHLISKQSCSIKVSLIVKGQYLIDSLQAKNKSNTIIGEITDRYFEMDTNSLMNIWINLIEETIKIDLYPTNDSFENNLHGVKSEPVSYKVELRIDCINNMVQRRRLESLESILTSWSVSITFGLIEIFIIVFCLFVCCIAMCCIGYCCHSWMNRIALNHNANYNNNNNHNNNSSNNNNRQKNSRKIPLTNVQTSSLAFGPDGQSTPQSIQCSPETSPRKSSFSQIESRTRSKENMANHSDALEEAVNASHKFSNKMKTKPMIKRHKKMKENHSIAINNKNDSNDNNDINNINDNNDNKNEIEMQDTFIVLNQQTSVDTENEHDNYNSSVRYRLHVQEQNEIGYRCDIAPSTYSHNVDKSQNTRDYLTSIGVRDDDRMDACHDLLSHSVSGQWTNFENPQNRKHLLTPNDNNDNNINNHHKNNNLNNSQHSRDIEFADILSDNGFHSPLSPMSPITDIVVNNHGNINDMRYGNNNANINNDNNNNNNNNSHSVHIHVNNQSIILNGNESHGYNHNENIDNINSNGDNNINNINNNNNKNNDNKHISINVNNIVSGQRIGLLEHSQEVSYNASGNESTYNDPEFMQIGSHYQDDSRFDFKKIHSSFDESGEIIFDSLKFIKILKKGSNFINVFTSLLKGEKVIVKIFETWNNIKHHESFKPLISLNNNGNDEKDENDQITLAISNNTLSPQSDQEITFRQSTLESKKSDINKLQVNTSFQNNKNEDSFISDLSPSQNKKVENSPLGLLVDTGNSLKQKKKKRYGSNNDNDKLYDWNDSGNNTGDKSGDKSENKNQKSEDENEESESSVTSESEMGDMIGMEDYMTHHNNYLESKENQENEQFLLVSKDEAIEKKVEMELENGRIAKEKERKAFRASVLEQCGVPPSQIDSILAEFGMSPRTPKNGSKKWTFDESETPTNNTQTQTPVLHAINEIDESNTNNNYNYNGNVDNNEDNTNNNTTTINNNNNNNDDTMTDVKLPQDDTEQDGEIDTTRPQLMLNTSLPSPVGQVGQVGQERIGLKEEKEEKKEKIEMKNGKMIHSLNASPQLAPHSQGGSQQPSRTMTALTTVIRKSSDELTANYLLKQASLEWTSSTNNGNMNFDSDNEYDATRIENMKNSVYHSDFEEERLITRGLGAHGDEIELKQNNNQNVSDNNNNNYDYNANKSRKSGTSRTSNNNINLNISKMNGYEINHATGESHSAMIQHRLLKSISRHSGIQTFHHKTTESRPSSLFNMRSSFRSSINSALAKNVDKLDNFTQIDTSLCADFISMYELKQYHDNNVIGSNNVLIPIGFTLEPYCCLVFEYMNGGDMKHYMQKRNFNAFTVNKAKFESSKSTQLGPLTLTEILIVLRNVCRGVSFLHNFGIVHNNIRCKNILLASTNEQEIGKITQDTIVKISEFFMLKKYKIGDNNSRWKKRYRWLAPECVEKLNEYDNVIKKYNDALSNKNVKEQESLMDIINGIDDTNIGTKASDIYAFGILMWQIFYSKKPFADMKLATFIENTLNDGLRLPTSNYSYHLHWVSNDAKLFSIVENLCDQYIKLMKDCWHQDPTMRPTIEQVDSALQLLHTAASNVQL